MKQPAKNEATAGSIPTAAGSVPKFPALKICRLATDSRYRGEGVGTMLVNMIIASYKKESKAGCRFITVDAYAGALDFYFKQGFAPLSKDDEGSDTRLLYFDLESFSAGDMFNTP